MKKSFLLFLMLLVSVNLFSQSWTEQSSNLTSVLYSVSAINDDIAWICGAGGKVLKTTNKGANWINVSSDIPSSYVLYNIFALDVNTALITGIMNSTTNSIFRTSNGGMNWAIVNTHTGFGDKVYMTSSSNAYFIGDVISGNWDLLSSTDGGLNWSVWSVLSGSSTAGSYANSAYFQGQQVWFGTIPSYKIMYSSNMGANWTAQTVPLMGVNSICFNSSTKGMAAGSQSTPGLLLTTNAGTNWVSITSPYPGSDIAGICYLNSAWWAAKGTTAATGISRSTNDGASWTNSYTVPGGNIRHMSNSRSGSTIWAVRDNGGISRYGTPIIGISSNSTELPSSFMLMQNYPNPFNPQTKIDFQIPEKKFVSIKVYDCLGKEISTLASEILGPGSYSVDFNASVLPGGVYFYRITAGGFSETKKMMLVK